MNKFGVLFSFFSDPKDAQTALGSLNKNGFRRRVLLQVSADGKITQRDPSRRIRNTFVLAGGFIFSTVGVTLSFIGVFPALTPLTAWDHLLIFLIGLTLGAGCGFMISAQLFPVVSRNIIERQLKWLNNEESLLIFQAPIRFLSRAVRKLRESPESEISIFGLHPQQDFPEPPVLRDLVTLPLEQFRTHALRLAREHQVDFQGGSNSALLDQLVKSRQTIHDICSGLTESARLEQSLNPVAEWILDNEYLIESHGRDVELNLPKAFYRELPTLTQDPDRLYPRVYSLAKEIVSHSDARLDRENIIEYLAAYQEGASLTIGELWALPLMLRIALIQHVEVQARQVWLEVLDREYADFWANRLLATLRRNPDQLFAVLADLAEERGKPSPFFATQLSGHLYDEDAALIPVQSWLERSLKKSLTEIHTAEQSRQAINQVSIGNAITSLRQLSLLDWRQIFELQSQVEQILRRDPAGIYPGMDFETRNQYREAVEELAKRSGLEENQVARRVVEVAAKVRGEQGWKSRQRHIGTFLIGEGREGFSQTVGSRERIHFRFNQWVYKHHTFVYLSTIFLLTIGLMALPFFRVINRSNSLVDILILLLLTFPASQLVTEWVNYLISRVLPARRLPKLDFSEDGIPDAYRTLVVVPMMLVDERTIQNEIEKLEIRYLGNKEQNLVFALFSDFTDADSISVDSDGPFLKAAEEGIKKLNQQYGENRFYLFHRQRTWSKSENKFIGWERKRGKLEELNGLILGQRDETLPSIVYVGDIDRLTDIRYIITLDSDTQLPRDSARRMIETLAHPLNQPRFDSEGKVAKGTYTLIQPRVSSTLPSAVASRFSRIFTDPVGTDPYTKVVSNAYQDLSGEGSYVGKGIYDPRAFHRMLADRFPDESLLSHDLIEGAYVRTGLATDIELFDEFPSNYITYSRRQHRWIRGDWQIAEWILPTVRDKNHQKIRNILGPLSRWKIFDNLRRSLVSPASIAALVLTWFLVPGLQLFSGVFVAAVIFSQALAGPLTWVTSRQGYKAFSLRQIRHDVTRALAEAVLLFHQAGLALDAIVRVLYRRLISKRGLLEWSTSQMELGVRKSRQLSFRLTFWLISFLSSGLALGVYYFRPENIFYALPWLILWMITPLVGGLLTSPVKQSSPHQSLPDQDLDFLRKIARRTWRYFADFVGLETAWLPPDNYQVSHQNQLAMRTSPTNIGMYMLSALAASDFGYQTLDQTIERLTETMGTLNKLERHEGHLLNWYNLQDQSPLQPRYVSSVDSGNFIATLWTLQQGIIENLNQPILNAACLSGLKDTAEILLEELSSDNYPSESRHVVSEILKLTLACPPEAIDLIYSLREIDLKVTAFNKNLAEEAGFQQAVIYWARQLGDQISAWMDIIDRYLGWLVILNEYTEGQILEAGLGSLIHLRTQFQTSPSLNALASGQALSLENLNLALGAKNVPDREYQDWIERLIESYATAKWLAGEMVGKGMELLELMQNFTEEINMAYLYDPVRSLFSIGYNLTNNQFDGSYYDLLASESRLGSYVAIARGDVPSDHWLALNRPYSSHGQHRVLLSWTGTMFEYLMPLLLQKTYPNSLIDQATREAVSLQIAYGRKRRVPWGISESAYGDLDLNKTYQYKAFGVPWLGLKRDLEDDLVVAPYATLLAVGIDPKAAVQNLKRLKKQGLLNEYGFFEAIDFNRRPKSDAQPGVVVRAYMAHHQGMAFLALTNFLHDNSMQRRFHQDPRVKTAEPLLYERVPVSPPLHHISTRDELPSRIEAMGVAPSVSKFDSPHNITPKVQLLSNGQLSTMTTTAGGGYTRWKDIDVTRWRSDITRDVYGSFLYLKDMDSGDIWSNMYHPLDKDPDKYTVHFPLDRSEYRRRDNGLETQTELIVAPEDDVEIRRITITNRSIRSRRIQATSYYELALSSHGADRQHPAFNKLFIQTEAVPANQTLLAYRRPRQEDDPSLYAFHSLDLIGGFTQPGILQFETDRRAFIGRGQSLRTPLAVGTELENHEGFVLDPIFSIRRSIILSPGESAQLISVLGIATDREQALSLVGKYHDSAVVDRAFDIAWASTQLNLRSLRIKPDEARRFQKLAGYLLYPSDYMRPPTERIAANRKGQSSLWPFGISGDLPVLLITISDVGDLGLVRQMLQAQAYWRQHGLYTDLVVLNEESSTYDQPLMERLERLIQSSSIYTGEDQSGAVFLLAVDQLDTEDLTLIQSVARISLIAARGPLAQQISVPYETVEIPAPLETKRIDEAPSRKLPFLELPYFNSLGGFSADGREYVIYLGPDTNTPAPWVNVIANPQFGTLVSETGAGFTWFGNSQRNRLTQWSNDPVLDPHSEMIYIRDEQSGKVWNPTAGPIRERDAYRISHGAGYSRFEHNSHAIEQLLTIFVPTDEEGGEPVKISKLSLLNDSRKTRKLSITYYVEWTLGEQTEDTQQHIVTEWDPKLRTIFARNRYHPDYSERVSFASISPKAGSYTGDRTLFLGRNKSTQNPDALGRIELAGRVGAELDPCGALQTKITLAPGESVDVICVLGQTGTEQEAGDLVRKYREVLAVNQALDETHQFWDRILNTVQVETPDLSVDFMLNRWLLYQSLSCRIWGRSAFYQSGGAIGFRDQLQDVAAFLLTNPDLAREHILLSASRQYIEGDVQHWWHPPGGAGIRSRISDDLLWLPYLTAQYVRVTGDETILQEQIPFLLAPELEPDQHEIFLEPQISSEMGSLFEHCRRAVERGRTTSPRGLPLIGTGDWNDGMNRVGPKGRGESVWLGWFLIEVLGSMEYLSKLVGNTELAENYHGHAITLETQIEKSAWDGEWYQRATFDDGSPLGSAANLEARIDSLPQSWPWISGAGDPDRKERALESAWRQLVRLDEKLILLFTPPFDVSTPSPGYIRGYPPGVRENGGQYTHAALWLAMAYARKGDGNKVGKLLQILNPVEHARDGIGAWKYAVEPYVVAADVYRLPGRIGQGGWSWYTGSAAWMYRVWIEEVLGFKKRGNRLYIDPVIPDWWDGFKIDYRYQGAIYAIEIQNPEHVQKGITSIELDGRFLDEKYIPLESEPIKHTVRVQMGNTS